MSASTQIIRRIITMTSILCLADCGTDALEDADNGFSLNGSSGIARWSSVETTTTADLIGVWGTDENNAWIVGTQGTVLRKDGLTWTSMPAPTDGALLDVWGVDADNVWVTGDTVYYWNGAEWADQGAGVVEDATRVWGFGLDDVWAAGYLMGNMYHWDGSEWSAMALPDRTHVIMSIYDVWGAVADDVWAVGMEFGSMGEVTAATYRWDGKQWSREPAGDTYWYRLGGIAQDDMWALGENYNHPEIAIMRWDGWSWSPLKQLECCETWLGLWGTTHYDIWLVGGDVDWYFDENNELDDWGEIVHWNGASLRKPDLDIPDPLNDVWGTDREDVWAVGNAGTILHFGFPE